MPKKRSKSATQQSGFAIAILAAGKTPVIPYIPWAPNTSVQQCAGDPNADPNVSQDPNVPSEIVEFTRSGHFVREFSVDPNLGSAFALGIESRVGFNVFAFVDDFLSTCTILDLAPGM